MRLTTSAEVVRIFLFAGAESTFSDQSLTAPAGTIRFVAVCRYEPDPSDEDQLGAHNLFVADDGIACLTRFFRWDDTALIAVNSTETNADGEAAELNRWKIRTAGGIDASAFENDDPDHMLNNPHQAYVEGARAYIAHWDAGCQVPDVSAPSKMIRIGGFGETQSWTDAPADDGESRRGSRTRWGTSTRCGRSATATTPRLGSKPVRSSKGPTTRSAASRSTTSPTSTVPN